MTTTQSTPHPGVNVPLAQPTQTLISAEKINPSLVPDLALTERVMEGTLPCVWVRWPDLPAEFPFPYPDPVTFLPAGARVTRSCCYTFTRDVYAEAAEYVLTLSISPKGAHIAVAAVSDQVAAEVGESIAAHFPSDPRNANQVNLTTWRCSRGGDVNTSLKELVVPAWDEIESNYPKRTQRQVASLMSLHPDHHLRGRIVLWHGPPGTGKTSAIRALFRGWSEWCQPELLMDPESAFSDPEYLYEILTHPIHPFRQRGGTTRQGWRLLVAEDADRYLQPTTRLRDNPALDRLLNVSDGILGQGAKLIILLTTNSSVASLHPALTRPGRCLAITEFEQFDRNAARAWLDGRAPTPSGQVTLAQLYELVSDEKRVGGFDVIAPGQYL